MTQFNRYAKQADEIIKIAIKEYGRAEEKYRDAESKARAYPERFGVVDGEYAAKSARYRADYLEAQRALETAKTALAGQKSALLAVRRELEEAVADEFFADPKKIDLNTMELLKSGIMSAGEYTRLMDRAKSTGNATMCRLCGKFAGDAATARENDGRRDAETASLRSVEREAAAFTGADVLESFDGILSIFDRCANNPGLCGEWESFTGAIIENF